MIPKEIWKEWLSWLESASEAELERAKKEAIEKASTSITDRETLSDLRRMAKMVDEELAIRSLDQGWSKKRDS